VHGRSWQNSASSGIQKNDYCMVRHWGRRITSEMYTIPLMWFSMLRMRFLFLKITLVLPVYSWSVFLDVAPPQPQEIKLQQLDMHCHVPVSSVKIMCTNGSVDSSKRRQCSSEMNFLQHVRLQQLLTKRGLVRQIRLKLSSCSQCAIKKTYEFNACLRLTKDYREINLWIIVSSSFHDLPQDHQHQCHEPYLLLCCQPHHVSQMDQMSNIPSIKTISSWDPIWAKPNPYPSESCRCRCRSYSFSKSKVWQTSFCAQTKSKPVPFCEW
jgi:hypothetical protein